MLIRESGVYLAAKDCHIWWWCESWQGQKYNAGSNLAAEDWKGGLVVSHTNQDHPQLISIMNKGDWAVRCDEVPLEKPSLAPTMLLLDKPLQIVWANGIVLTIESTKEIKVKCSKLSIWNLLKWQYFFQFAGNLKITNYTFLNLSKSMPTNHSLFKMCKNLTTKRNSIYIEYKVGKNVLENSIQCENQDISETQVAVV